MLVTRFGPCAGVRWAGFAGLLLYYSASTVLEEADGNWLEAVAGLGEVSLEASVQDLSAAFDEHIWPVCAGQRTRHKNWRHWCTVLTWGIVRKALPLLMPISRDTLKAISRDTLKAITWDLVCCRASRSQIVAVWSAVSSRHRCFGFTSPRERRLLPLGTGNILRHGPPARAEAAGA